MHYNIYQHFPILSAVNSLQNKNESQLAHSANWLWLVFFNIILLTLLEVYILNSLER